MSATTPTLDSFLQSKLPGRSHTFGYLTVDGKPCDSSLDAPVISSQPLLTGSCFCGAVSFSLREPPDIGTAYCHCTRCQKQTGCPFIHVLICSTPIFAWTQPTRADMIDVFHNEDEPCVNRYRCKKCGTCIAVLTSDTQRTGVWGGTLARDKDGRILRWEVVKPTAHMFYGSRMLDVSDDLGKWEGYEGSSERIG